MASEIESSRTRWLASAALGMLAVSRLLMVVRRLVHPRDLLATSFGTPAAVAPVMAVAQRPSVAAALEEKSQIEAGKTRPCSYLAAAAVGLDAARFERDLAEHEYGERVREDFLSGVRSGVNGAPTFYINGIRPDGSYDLDTLLAALGEADRA